MRRLLRLVRVPSAFVFQAMALAVSLTAFSLDARAECTKDIECKGERICTDGACVDPPRSEGNDAQLVAPAASPTPSGAVAPVVAPGEPRNRAMMNAGIGLTVAGAATLIAAVAVTIDAAAQVAHYNSAVVQCQSQGEFTRCTTQSRPADVLSAAIALWFVTPPLLASGIPLWVVGGRRVPAPSASARSASLALDGIMFDGRQVVVGFRF
jgi:hypothetical protein